MKLYHGSYIAVDHPEITFQYFFGSEKALEKLNFLC